MKRVEFHVHTKYSKDSILGLFLLTLRCKIKKIDALAICDHNEIKGAQIFKEKLEKKGISVIVGEEIFTQDGEIIGLYLNERIEPNLSAKETIKRIREQQGLVYVPHPFEEKRSKSVLKEEAIKANIDEIDLMELHNGRNRSWSISKKQEEMVKKYEVVGVVASDAHSVLELGRNIVEVDSIKKEELIDSLKSAKYQKHIALFGVHTWTKVVRFGKMIGRGDFRGLCRTIKHKFKR